MKQIVTHVGDIYKMQRTGSQEAPGGTPTYSSVNLTISPTGNRYIPSEGGVSSYQLFEIFIFDATVAVNNGDRIVAAGKTYLVTDSPNFYDTPYIQATSVMAYVVM